MTLPYSGALAKILDVSQSQRADRRYVYQNVPLSRAIGRTAARDIISPKSLPEHDTSAMDGYAIHAQATESASQETPTVFRVEGSIAAGDDPKALRLGMEDGGTDWEACVEIMTGAIFPDGPPSRPFDACVKVEDTLIATPPEDGDGRYVLVTQPIVPGANKRFARRDISKGDIIAREGEVIQPSHILPLASVGFESIALIRRPRVGIFSTGLELTNGNGATADANGPYLTAVARDMGIEADFHGILDDDPSEMYHHLRKAAESSLYDLIITSGGVSKGRVDHIPRVLLQLDADVVFHGLSIRPGHPVLFAQVPTCKGQVPFFGLPGNPGAATACFRFLVVPYLRSLQGQERELSLPARLRQTEEYMAKQSSCSKPASDYFRHGILSTTSEGQLMVEPSSEQSPAKLGPFTAANCWIHFRGGPGCEGDVVGCYPFSPTGIQLSPNF